VSLACCSFVFRLFVVAVAVGVCSLLLVVCLRGNDLAGFRVCCVVWCLLLVLLFVRCRTV